MNNNTNLITHMRTDPNAHKHAYIGMLCSLAALPFIYFGSAYSLVSLFLPLCAGISIEIVQRIAGGLNTNRESFMDMLTTWLWPVFYVQKMIQLKGK